MKVTPLAIPEVLIVEPRVFSDARGFFYESFNARTFRAETGLDVEFVQDNHSRSSKGVLRGLHYQLPPSAQGKLVRVVRGSIFDVAVDLRKSSVTFGQWVTYEMSENDPSALWIPPGFAHGFQVTSDVADVFYKTTDYYSAPHGRCVAWNDARLSIKWPHQLPVLSDQDRVGSTLDAAELFD